MSVDQEKRHRPRADIRWPVTVNTSEGTMRGEIANVSSTGIFINCEKPLRVNSVFDLRIEVPIVDRYLMATAEVVWSSGDDPDTEAYRRGMAVRFTKISGTDRKVIADAVILHLNLRGITPDDDTLEIVIDPNIS
jgi:uncharacterized protein (TIGR02266 family)